MNGITPNPPTYRSLLTSSDSVVTNEYETANKNVLQAFHLDPAKAQPSVLLQGTLSTISFSADLLKESLSISFEGFGVGSGM
jgi:hypothetical protein